MSDTDKGSAGTRRLAYADPPYVGCAKFYDHPESHVWNRAEAHGHLMTALDEEYDGWALSCSSTSLRDLLLLAPEGVRVAAWVKPFAAFKRNVRIAYAWEPVIFKPGRDSSKDGAPVGRDFHAAAITLKKGLVGAKPESFCRWVLDLLGYVDGDELVDVFPGTGIMGRVLAQTKLDLATAPLMVTETYNWGGASFGGSGA